MSWSIIPNNGNRVIKTEAQTYANASTVLYSTPINWFDMGSTFRIYMNLSTVAWANTMAIDVQGSFDGATWQTVNTAIIASAAAASISTANYQPYDSTNPGSWPIYRLTITPGGAVTGEMKYAVIAEESNNATVVT
jgi:hypothetical protein